MKKPACLVAGLGLAAALAAPAGAQLLTHKDLSLETALKIATTAEETCKARGYRVSVTVVGRNGEVIVLLRGDDAPPHTVENSRRKAYTARTFRISSGQFAERVKNNPTIGLVHLSGVIANQGALPIKSGDEVIGGVGVSGSPGGDKDEACAKAGLDKVADQLK
ncbi:MAG TPA: heme-binding protein [Stellaceae bacterium]|nr:heme-binding protein [Stellaceae bacterium]